MRTYSVTAILRHADASELLTLQTGIYCRTAQGREICSRNGFENVDFDIYKQEHEKIILNFMQEIHIPPFLIAVSNLHHPFSKSHCIPSNPRTLRHPMFSQSRNVPFYYPLSTPPIQPLTDLTSPIPSMHRSHLLRRPFHRSTALTYRVNPRVIYVNDKTLNLPQLFSF